MQIRQCKIGDTVSTVRPMSEFAGGFAGSHLAVTCDTQAACDEANHLIGIGRWRVSSCGKCSELVETCQCEMLS